MYQTISEDQSQLAEIQFFRNELNRTIQPQIMPPSMSTRHQATHQTIQQRQDNVANVQTLPPLSISLANHSRTRARVVPSRSPTTCDGSNVEQSSGHTITNVILDPYSCQFLSQLQGSYQTDSLVINVVVPPVKSWQKQHAVVQRTSLGDQSTLVNQIVYDEGRRFRLCSADGKGIGVMSKGMSMQHTVVWRTGKNGEVIIWRRKGTIVFDLVPVVPLSPVVIQQPTSRSVCSPTSQGSTVSSPEYGSVDVPMHNSESLQLTTLRRYPSGSSDDSYRRYITDNTKVQREEALFERIKKHCSVHPSLLKKIVEWGISEVPNIAVGRKTVEELSKGRVWVSATLDESAGCYDRDWQHVVDDLKGAYQEVEPDVYVQPCPEQKDLGVQHRLRKSFLDLWLIEENDAKTGTWLPCAQELKNGKWIDLKNSRRMINVQMVSMSSVLQKMGYQQESKDLEKYLDFLFTACNQRKLLNKLKSRNLKHNIANLKLKLEKQYALSFAIKVVQTADSIAREVGVF